MLQGVRVGSVRASAYSWILFQVSTFILRAVVNFRSARKRRS